MTSARRACVAAACATIALGTASVACQWVAGLGEYREAAQAAGHPPPDTPCAPGALVVSHPQPNWLALDAESVYWVDYGTPSDYKDAAVWKVSKAGGTAISLAAKTRGNQIAVDDTYAYWTDGFGPDPTYGLDQALKADGGDLTFVQLNHEGDPGPIALSDAGVYIGTLIDTPSLLLVPPGAGASVLTPMLGEASQIAVGPTGTVYWGDSDLYLADGGVDYSHGAVEAMDPGATARTIAQSTASSVVGVLVDATGLYWATSLGVITRAGLDGSNPTTIAKDTNGGISAIAMDGTNVYWAGYGTNSLVRSVPKQGGPIATIAQGQTNPSAIAVDTNCVYWLNQGTQSTAGGYKGDGAVMAALKQP